MRRACVLCMKSDTQQTKTRRMANEHKCSKPQARKPVDLTLIAA